MTRTKDAPDLVIFPPVLIGGVLLLGLGIHYALWTVTLLPVIVARGIGLTVFVSAGTLAYLAERAMKRVGTNVLPTQPTLALATDGPYRYTRNPLYIAAIGMYLGVTLWVDGLAPLLLLFPVAWLLHWGVVLREEGYLQAKFGAAYDAYRSDVRRWV